MQLKNGVVNLSNAPTFTKNVHKFTIDCGVLGLLLYNPLFVNKFNASMLGSVVGFN